MEEKEREISQANSNEDLLHKTKEAKALWYVKRL